MGGDLMILHEAAANLRQQAKGSEFEDKGLKIADDLDAMGYVWEAMVDGRVHWHNAALEMLIDHMVIAEQNQFMELVEEGAPTLVAVEAARRNALETVFIMAYELGMGEYNIDKCVEEHGGDN
jgi:hypothetical protein